MAKRLTPKTVAPPHWGGEGQGEVGAAKVSGAGSSAPFVMAGLNLILMG